MEKLRADFILLYLIIILLSSCKHEPKNDLSGFVLESGFNITKVASEPLIKDPVDLEFGTHGEAYVLEMPGYPFEDVFSKVILLKDRDKDGIFDDSKVFAENLQLGSSILLFRKGLLVAAPPYLLYIEDKNGDEISDHVDTLMSGFSTGNLQHNYNGLTYGLDGWIYAVNGGNSGQPFWWGDTTSRIDLRGQDFRFNLNSKKLERIGRSSGGFGLAMDEWDHPFETHNLNHISNLVYSGRYQSNLKTTIGHSLLNISDHEENGLARIYPIGEQESRVNHPEQSGYFSGSCGITYYNNGRLGPDLQHTVWVADVVLNLIHIDKISSNGAALRASRLLDHRDFLASSDRSFRPVNMSAGPDGAMYIVDMHRKVIEHPEWIPDEIENTLDMNEGKEKGRIYKITLQSGEPSIFDYSKLDSFDGRLACLGDDNQWVRKTAHRLILEHNPDDLQIIKLKELTLRGNEMSRLHALWILNSLRKVSDQELLNGLKDPSSGIREQSLLMVENRLDSNDMILNACIQLLTDENQRTRMQAALSTSVINQKTFNMHRQDILSAIFAAVHLPMDEWNTSALSLASKFSPVALFDQVITLPNSKNKNKLLITLALLASASDQDMTSLMQSLSSTKISDQIKSEIILNLSLKPNGQSTSDQLKKSIQTLELSKDKQLIGALAQLRNKMGWPMSNKFRLFSEEALHRVLLQNIPDSERLEYLNLLDLAPFDLKSSVLFACLQNNQPVSLQQAALQQLSKVSDVKVGFELIRAWATLSPQTRRSASDILLYKQIHHPALLDGLEKGTINIGEMNFDLERRRRLLWWTDDENIKKRAQALFSDAGVTTRQEAIDKMYGAIKLQGSVDKGARIFEGLCSQCHQYGSVGQKVGPVLTEINRKSKETLLHDILDPNAATDPKYISHQIETLEGEIHIGIIDAESDLSITIKKMGGTTLVLNKKDIKSLTALGKSLMMEGLEGNMTVQDMADLLAYLQSNK
ncbi:MAG: c-type cytochrome [Saprospiraceae bacterium]|jgi:putative membrane-bound dehydrogenase-like protein|nr:c-type cytochrome [Saprospiraceae bacterium]MBK8281161.1 c-type cytochrome [Saprospiraceae bacterium]MBK9679918.1 c-type cytochrome [Saprospiraceae bacterium]MBK9929053.1 c-type cytochrome [Saprospiraceae bacterium]MBP8094908.1 c-type cytochrome [Saprospiraceae bacterium]